jgi:Ca-activated chloride channel family protein
MSVRVTQWAAALAALVTITLASVADGRAAEAGKPAPTVLIIDSSGSMAAREPDGRAKLDAARDTVVEALRGWAPGTELALMAYGHRRESDCADIETLLPMGPLSPPEVARKLAALRARGKTPLSESLRQAAALLPEGGGAIVLVSDGLETCNADPCAVATALREAHANLDIHVIGFGVTKEETTQLQCIAEDGGGHYFGAADAGGLATAMGDVKQEIEQAPPTPPEPPAPVQEPPPGPVPVQLVAVAGALGKIVDAPVTWHVVTESGEAAYDGESRALSLTLPPGKYRAEARAANAGGESAFAVDAAEGAARAFEVPVTAGRLDLAVAANAKSEPFTEQETEGIAWTIEPKDGQGPVTVPPLARPSLLLAPGHYVVRARLQDMEAEAPVEIAPGKPVALTLDFKLGSVTLEAALTEEGPALVDDGALSWRIGEGEAARKIEGQSHPRVTLREGTHPVTLSVGGAEVTTSVEIAAGEDRTQRVIVKGGELQLSARLGPQSPVFEDWRDTTWTVEPIEAVGVAAGPENAQQVPEAAPTLPLSPGRWRVSLVSGAVTVQQEVVVAPEKVTPLVVDLGAARLTVRAAAAAGDPPSNIVISVFALGADGEPAADAVFGIGTSDETSTIVAAGRWRVTALDDQNRAAQSDVELKAGEERSLDLKLQ